MIATKQATYEVVIQFLEEHILTRFGTPFTLVCDSGSGFTSLRLTALVKEHNILISYSTNY